MIEWQDRGGEEDKRGGDRGTGDEPGFGGGRGRTRVSNERKQIKSERSVGYKLVEMATENS
jgi:hypothetical protein